MKGHFRYWVIAVAIFCAAFFVALLCLLIWKSILRNEGLPAPVMGSIIFCLFILLLLLREMRFKFNAIRIIDNGLEVRSFLGLGPMRIIGFHDIDAIHTTTEPSKISDGDGLYIYVDGTRTIEIFDTYYKNFDVFVGELRKRGPFKYRYEPFRYLKAYLNLFGIPIRLDNEE